MGREALDAIQICLNGDGDPEFTFAGQLLNESKIPVDQHGMRLDYQNVRGASLHGFKNGLRQTELLFLGQIWIGDA